MKKLSQFFLCVLIFACVPFCFSQSIISLVSVQPSEQFDTYIIGENVQSITAKRTVFPFKISRFETSYQLWYEVLTKAQEIGYSFQNPGQEGSAGRRGRVPTEKGQFEPVTSINWRDAIVWCNALSELQGLDPCYTYNGKILRSSFEAAECDLAECAWNANGFRLPTETEWEYAARKRIDGKFARGDLPSGIFNAQEPWANLAWYFENTDKTKPIATTGTAGNETDVGLGKSNALALFDMSGNVLEFCWDWLADYAEEAPDKRATGPSFGYERISRGGSWSPYTVSILCGDRYGFDPDESYNYLGFRIVQSINQSTKND